MSDSCFVVDSPQQLLDCHVVTPFEANTQVKLFGSYPLPGDVIASGIFQNVSGPVILASYSATNAQIAPSLGRNLAAVRHAGHLPLHGDGPVDLPLAPWSGRQVPRAPDADCP